MASISKAVGKIWSTLKSIGASDVIQISILFSGWLIFGFSVWTNEPLIKGQICQVMTASTIHPEKPGENITVFFVYLYMTNARENAVHILDYELEVDTGSGYERMIRLYGLEQIPSHEFHSEDYHIEIPDFSEKVITAETEPLKYGHPLHGFVTFGSERPQEVFLHAVTKKFRITCIDAFNKRHKIVTTSDQFMDIRQLRYLADMLVEPK